MRATRPTMRRTEVHPRRSDPVPKTIDPPAVALRTGDEANPPRKDPSPQ